MEFNENKTPIENENKTSTSKFFKRAVLLMWIGAIGLVLGIFFFFFTLSNGDLPTFEDLENPEYNEASIIYDTNGDIYGKYYVENRIPIKYDQINPHVLDALISTEDERFHSHSGIDFRALGRVAVKSLLLQKGDAGGGSTISQQLAKLLFKRPSMRGMNPIKRMYTLVTTKFKEWITAVKLERAYTKEEIIEMYLNKFEFINGAFGIQAAAETYFDKNQKDMSIDESAILVGMLQNPSLYNPRRFPKKAESRRNEVLSTMLRDDKINRAQHDSLSAKVITMDHFVRTTQSEGPAPHFRSELTKWLKNTLKEKNIVKSDGSEYNIYTDGLKIYTTIDLNYQKYAEQAVAEHMKNQQKTYWRVWKKGDPWTYEAEPEQIEIRKNMLQRRMKASDRYLNLRNKVLGQALANIQKKYKDLPMSDNVIKTLLEVENKKTSLSDAVKSNKLKSEYRKDYDSFINNSLWGGLKKRWSILTDKYEKEFDTPVKMIVFDHEKGEKEVTWTPKDSVKYYNKHLQAGMLAVDPKNGHIKAWVGGFNHKYFKYDHVNTRRQVGSTIKPFVYATAISLQGLSPCDKFQDIQYTISPGEGAFKMAEPWSPANANGKFSLNEYNLYQGLLYSKNSITVALVKQMGNMKVVRELLHNAGLNSDLKLPDGRLAVPELPSICLGAVDLTLKEMTGAYTIFSNNGAYTEPIFVTRIEDKNGRVIFNGVPDRRVALNPRHNSIMVQMLQNNTAGRYSMGLKSQYGGKTGTTNDYTDGWFMGITPELVVGTWTGGDDTWIRFKTLDNGQGFKMARPIFQKFIKKLEKDTSTHYNADAKFPEMSPDLDGFLNCSMYNEETPEELEQMRLEQERESDEFEEDDEGFEDDTLDRLPDLGQNKPANPVDSTKVNKVNTPESTTEEEAPVIDIDDIEFD